MRDARDARRQRVVEAWREEGLALNDVYGSTGGKLGNSFDAQRLILLARAQSINFLDKVRGEVYHRLLAVPCILAFLLIVESCKGS